ncbi:MAG: globin domain-containing protein [Myxococcales bacterium]
MASAELPDRRLLEESFELALLRDPEFPQLFYEILFREHPTTQPLFRRNSPNAQRLMLSKALTAALDHLDDEAWLERELAPLGRGHVAYGVTREMYGWVGASLIAAIAEVCDEQWSPAHEQAWSSAYARIARVMLGEPR